MTLDLEIKKRKLYHKYDIRLLNNLNMITWLKSMNKFLSNYDPLSAEFNQYIYSKYN